MHSPAKTVVTIVIMAGFILGAAPVHIQGGDEMSEREKVIKTSQAIKKALMHNDLEALKTLYAADYEGIDIRGETDNLAMILQAYQPEAVTLNEYVVEDLQVEVFANIAILRGKGRIKGTFQGHSFGHVVRFTDIYKKSDGNWQCWRAHLTEVQSP